MNYATIEEVREYLKNGEKQIEKYYNEKGEVAVLYSPGWGAGWSTWASEAIRTNVLFNKTIVELVLANKRDEITQELCERLFDLGCFGFYAGGARDLQVKFLPPGTRFFVTEYDGAETVEVLDQIPYVA